MRARSPRTLIYFFTSSVYMLFPVKLFIEHSPEVSEIRHSLYVLALNLQDKV